MLMIGSNESVQATILGGTHVPMAPVADYLEAVYALLLNRMGAAVNIRTIRAGYFPRGGGMLEITVSGASLAPIDLAERGRLVRLRGFITTSGLPGGVAERGAVTLRKELKGYGVPVTIEKRDLDGNGEGAAVMLAAECATGIGGWSSLGERGKPIERVAFETVNGFKRWYATNTSVDEHLADQLPLLCACAGGVSRWHTPVVTEHLRTVLWVVSKFVPVRATITEREDGSGEVEIRGS
jgi:RNA 3'-terminal phosphate cyclase (ATP)